MLKPGPGVCPLLAGEDGRQCLSLARRKRKGKVNLYTPVTEREDGFHSCSESIGRDRRAKCPCDSCEQCCSSVPKRGVSPWDWQPTELFSKLPKDMASSHHFPSITDFQRQEKKKNDTLYNVLEDKFGYALLLGRDGREKRTGIRCFADLLWLLDCLSGWSWGFYGGCVC